MYALYVRSIYTHIHLRPQAPVVDPVAPHTHTHTHTRAHTRTHARTHTHTDLLAEAPGVVGVGAGPDRHVADPARSVQWQRRCAQLVYKYACEELVLGRGFVTLRILCACMNACARG